MINPGRFVRLGAFLVVFGSMTLGVPAFAQGNAIARLEAFRGGVNVIRGGLSQTVTASMPLQTNDVIVTRQGRASVRFVSDGSVVRIGPNSRVEINETAGERGVTAFLGKLWAKVVRAQDRVSRIQSGSTIAAIRGTEVSIVVAVDSDETTVSVIEGTVEASTDAGSLTLEGGQSATGRSGAAPTRGVRVRPQDAVQWALYYVPVLHVDPSTLGSGSWQDAVRQANQSYLEGALQKAIEAVENVDAQDPRFLTYRASLYLSSGSTTEAESDISRALALNANDVNALSLQTVIAVVTNNVHKALTLGERAVAADSSSSTAHVALSYARQAAFDLTGARQSLETAVVQSPSDPLAWARLGEIRSSTGDLGGALEAAERAVEIEPNLSRTQTVLGFAYLTRVQTAQAKEAFERAIELDQDDPLPRLGHGLARIRDGELAEGTKELEIAVSLDPAQAVVRSYLGKGYFEAKRGDLVEREYDVAKESDPNDPTPWFYDAINKQTTNRPVEALKSVDEAIEKNDNRAVYRSRLLLDSDLAARSAGLGRIYSDLGFQDLALVEGWKSLLADPTNYSAHRFLADSYAALPRHEIARVSELLQSQLLQPINTTPIQPRLGESNLFVISAGGPGSLSFNEFNPLFSRNGMNLQTTGLAGDDGLWSGEAVVAGILGKASLSLGYNQFETDGWREHAFQEDTIGNAFIQFELAPETSIQAEYRYRDSSHGDLQQRFFREDFLAGMVDDSQRETLRVGGRHTFSPSNTFLISAIHQDTDSAVRTADALGPGTSFDVIFPQKSYGGEVQHLFRSRYVDATSGVGFFNIDGEIQINLVFGEFVQALPAIPNKFEHLNAYSYFNIKPADTLTLTLGGSVDHLTGDVLGDESSEFNPKFGVTWNPVPSTTIRASAFRGMKRTLITDQTLEPTQVAGFNQFYDEANQTESWRYGGAIDQKFGRSVFGGVEYSMRDLTVPILFAPPDSPPDVIPEVLDGVEDQSMARAYLFATPHPWVGLRLQYIYEHFERKENMNAEFRDLETQRVPIGVSIFHPSGFSASVTGTYWDQTGVFLKTVGPGIVEEIPGSDQYWLVDLTINFRLPNRFGFLTVGATNLLDTDFNYFEVDFDNPTIQPKRAIFARFTLAVP